MLYISRQITYNTYGVFDTDDGVETQASDELIHEAISTGLTIYGVHVQRGKWNQNSKTVDIVPYQPVETMTAAQTKAKTLLHTHITVFRNEITSIIWDRDAITTPVRIRLGVFGNRLGHWAIVNNLDCAEDKAILEFDDSIEVDEAALFSTSMNDNMGAVFDLRAVHSHERAVDVYKQLAACMFWEKASKYIIDSKKRKEFMKERLW